ncbi:MAG TPA: ABC transporter permease [Capillimicrobium sp.]|nr:ABC transporter permease [Capillimicrobium sp.]
MSTAPHPVATGGVAGGREVQSPAAPRQPRITAQQISALVPVALFLVLFFVMIAVQGEFSWPLLQTVLETTVPLLLISFGQTLVILTGGIDLSVGGIMSLVTAFVATKMTGDGDVASWLPLVLLIGLAGGTINGLLIVRTGIQPFIVTLASWSVFAGLALLVLPTEGGTVAVGLSDALTGDAAGLPKAVWILIVLVAIWLVLRRTRFGISVLSVGSNSSSAHLNGVPVKRTLVAVYALSGLFAALAGVYLSSAVTFSGSPVAGEPLILLSVAAVVIGGSSLAGGRGSYIGTILGALSLSFIAQIVFFSGAESYWSQFVQGLLVLGAVLLFSVVELVLRRRTTTAVEEV